MRQYSIQILCLYFIMLCSCDKKHSGSQSFPIDLSNDKCVLEVDLLGGAITSFNLKSNTVNPLSWSLKPEQMPENNRDGAVFKGHFLCTNRWGAPSEGEMKAGIPHNGVPSNTLWTIDDQSSKMVKMTNTAPQEGLSVTRTIQLINDQSVFVAEETFKNIDDLGRLTNIVQHVTLGPPYLSPATIINTNAGRGFNQKYAFPNPESFEYQWPMGVVDTTKSKIDMRRSDMNINFVTTHIFPDSIKYGWITALNQEEGLLIGYIWKISEYPWLNIWHQTASGKPVAKGLEFGTTGIGQPYEKLVMNNTLFHGQQSFIYHDAKAILTKTYAGFLIEVPEGTTAIENIMISDFEQFTIEAKTRGGTERLGPFLLK